MIDFNALPQPEDSHRLNPSVLEQEQNVTAEYHLKLGKIHYKNFLTRSCRTDLDAAVEHFQKAVEMKPNLAEAYVQLASALWDQGTINLELAQFYCETALKIDPGRADANLYLGYFLQRAGFLDDAMQQYQTAAIKSFFKSSRPRIAMASTLLKQAQLTASKGQQVGLTMQGLGQFLGGLMLLPFDTQTCSLLKDALISDVHVYTLEYLALGCKKIGLHTVAKSLYRLGTKAVPNEPVFYHLLGDEYLYSDKQPRKALEMYRKVSNLEPKNLIVLKKLGKAHADCQDIDQAILHFQSALEVDEDDFDSLYNLAQLYTEQHAYFKALYYFKESVKRRPRHPYVHSNMGYVLFKMEDLEGALEEYKNALNYGSDPTWLSTVAQTVANMIFEVQGDTAEALEYIQQAIHYNPHNQDAIAALADLYFEAGQLDLAITAYRTLLHLDPQNADCYNNIGYILWQMDRNEEAIDAYQTSIHYNQENPIAFNNLGVIFLDDESNAEDALPLFQQALELNPEYTLAAFNLGRAYQMLGDTLSAAKSYGEALRLNENNPELDSAEIQERLDQLFG